MTINKPKTETEQQEFYKWLNDSKDLITALIFFGVTIFIISVIILWMMGLLGFFN